MTRFFATFLLIVLPLSAGAEALSSIVDNYVTDFDAAKLSAEEVRDIRSIHARADLSHGLKVLMVHEILLNANALEHAEMHYAEPRPLLLSAAD